MTLEFKLIGIIRMSLRQCFYARKIDNDTYLKCDVLLDKFLKLDEVLNISKDDSLYIWNK